ncbi:MAG: FAD-dependent oxidoreductase [Acidobacteriota bacterium]
MRVAIVGGGISGLMAAHLLTRRCDVRVYEAAAPGGHSETVDVEEGDRRIPVDLGFIVYNEQNYPLFTRLLRELDVATEGSEMSLSVQSPHLDLEWNGSTVRQAFGQLRNLWRPSHYGMLLDILRFHRRAPRLLAESGGESLGETMAREGFAAPFLERYLYPMTAAVWSTPPGEMASFPTGTLLRFLDNHGMLQVEGRPPWRTITGGSRQYVAALLAGLEGRVLRDTPVESVRRFADRVEVRAAGRETEAFDQVVLALHSDQALILLADPSEQEREILKALRYRSNDVVFHTDRNLLPQRRRLWASWNVRVPEDLSSGVRVTYWMNRLQNIVSPKDYCVTLNQRDAIDPSTILEQRDYSHPQFDRAALAAQRRWDEISGHHRTHYCGAYWGYGFHEDGVRSAVRVARRLGVEW